MVLFATPFIAVGGFMAFSALRTYLRDGATQQVLLFAAVGIAFGGAGLFVLIATLAGGRSAIASGNLQAEHPSEPWLWNVEWANRRISDHAVSSTVGLWAATLIIAAILAPGLILAPQKAANRGLLLIFGVFGLVVIGFFVAAIRSTLQAHRFHSVLVLDTLPGAIGGALRAHVEVKGDVDALRNAQAINITLTSLHRLRTSTGKSRTTHDSILWQDTSSIAGSGVSIGPSGAIVTVEFAIPADATPTNESNPNDQTLWRVNVDADIPGVDYDAHFWVPVFRTAAAPSVVRSAPAFHPQPAAVVHTIPEQETAAGLRLDFKAFRAPSMAAGLAVFTLVWIGAIVLMIRLEAPLMLTAVFTVFGLLLLYGTVNMLFGASTVTVSRDSVLIEPRMIIRMAPKTIPRAEITAVQLKIREQSSSSNSATPYYDLEILTRDGRTTTLGNLIRSKAEGERLVEDVRRRLQIS